MKVIVTGIAGFIGCHLLEDWLTHTDWQIVGIDALTYAANRTQLTRWRTHPRFNFHELSINDPVGIRRLFHDVQPDALVNLAAETHVDRSIIGPGIFFETNVLGTINLLECSRHYWSELAGSQSDRWRFLQVSTDEVFGTLDATSRPFREQDPYRPNSPYAASKAAADHAVRAWYQTYGLPTLTSYSCNNMGTYQYPEKLVPVVISRACQAQSIPVYGSGQQCREWIPAREHARGLRLVLERGMPGECYALGGGQVWRNADLVAYLCGLLNEIYPARDNPNARRAGVEHYRELIRKIADRPGHDFRYQLDHQIATQKLGWNVTVDWDREWREVVRTIQADCVVD